ncbi:MAG TPA: lamin tail domain-containing protein, partial [Pseudolysinimonas sp.]|nr:lamin tail domain-containing protein [Pseudolysinimonas sp.]
GEADDLSGWQLYRCTATGRARPDTLQLTIPQGTVLEPGERWVAAGPGFTGRADARYATSLADVEFGVLLRDDEDALVDRVAVSTYDDSACQGEKLAAVIDPVAGESYQRVAGGYVLAPRTPGAANATRDDSVFAQDFSYPEQIEIAISELATDPSPEGMPAGTVQRNFVELANYGEEPVSIGGWTAWRCEADGARAFEPQFTIPPGTSLAPGEVFLAAREGTKAAASADVSYDTALSLLGAGIWLADARGNRIDSVGIYAANEMDHSNVTPSPCTKGVALTTYQPDRLLHETFQRSRFTGVDADDFVVAEATPGVLDLVPWIDPRLRVDMRSTLPAAPAAQAHVAEAEGEPLVVLEAWGGTTENGPLATLAGENEFSLDLTAGAPARDDGYAFPYQRLVLDADGLTPGATVNWVGQTAGRGELQLSVWSAGAWRFLDAATGPDVVLSGELEAADLDDDRVTLLVQNGPRTKPTLAPERDGALEDPGAYDFAVSHITDTQYLSESYPEVYAQLVSWVAENADARKIEFATHTGDLVQNWVDPDQNEERARREFATASAIQAILDDAGMPNSVLPGNHDNKRGATNEMFNEFFGPERYAETPWYGGSIAPDDNSANFSTFEHEGAKFLMLSLPYAYAEAEIDWAESVVVAHPEYNVIISTHEHVTPEGPYGPAERSAASRWISRGGELWRQVIAPNRNVVLVLSGHFHGLGQLRTEDAGGIPGHDVVELLADYQEFRTHTGERASGFQRLLQIDLASGSVAVDTFSLRLEASSSFEYDYQQFLPDNGSPSSASNVRPWRIVAAGLQGRYTAEDDEFLATVAFQYPKLVQTSRLTVESPPARAGAQGRYLRLAKGGQSAPTGML